MRDFRKDRLTEIVDVASGNANGDGVRPEDKAKLAQFQKVVSHLRAGHFDAPPETLAKAKSLVPKLARKRLSVVQLGTSLGLAGVRLESGVDTQAVFEAEGTRVRIMYSQIPQGLRVFGRVEGNDWSAVCDGQEVVCEPDGQFEFLVNDFANSAVLLRSSATEFSIPSFKELVQSDDELDRPR